MSHQVIGRLSGRSRLEDFGFRISDFEFADTPEYSRPTASQRMTGRDGALPGPQAAYNSKFKIQNSKLNTDPPGWIFIPNSEFRNPNSYGCFHP